MRQLTQRLKDGQMDVLEVPMPALDPGAVLVRTHASVISAGTEGRTVGDARKGYVGKAIARQAEVKQVLKSVQTNGAAATYRMVSNKLEAPTALGYSCAGEVIAVGDRVTDLNVGDRVACGGSGAAHAEVVAVPRRLCAVVPDGVDMSEAAFATIGAVALQGIRQADVAVGGTVVVIGLGLVGLLTVKLLGAAGIRAIGIDLDAAHVKLAEDAGARPALLRSRDDLEAVIAQATRGAGADAVIITAGTSSTDPVDLAGRLCMPRGRVVVVGNAPTGFERKPYYLKELDLRMSCSYGPGRYDPVYEDQGVDYPIGHVRWTENRNQQAVLDLLGTGRLNLGDLITHTFPLDRAPEAYAMVVERSEPFVGIVLQYDIERPLGGAVTVRDLGPAPAGEAGLGFVGAGSFAQNMLLPAVQAADGRLVSVATARPFNARGVADRFGFARCTGDADAVVADPEVGAVFVATRHDLHARFTLEALRHGKHVFVEKPLCLTREELAEIRETWARSDAHLMVGFNRRFSPLVQDVMAWRGEGAPVAIQYRINAGTAAPDHWVHDPAVGGGRILGEVCHFIDLASFIARAPVTSVAATGMKDAHALNDTVSISLGFGDGSTASILYASNGSTSLPKERLEVFSAGRVAVLDDFKSLTLHADKTTTRSLRRQDKGHHEGVARFLRAVREGGPTPVPFAESVGAMQATFDVIDAIRGVEA